MLDFAVYSPVQNNNQLGCLLVFFFRLFLVSMAFVSCAYIPEKDQALAPRVAAWRAEAGVQGVAVAIYEAGEVQSTSDGVREASGDAIEYDDSFSVASVSKSFTAAAILQLVDQDIFDLGDSAAVLSGLEIPGDITVAQLLRHEAGMPEYMGGSLNFETFLSEHAKGRETWSGSEIRAFAISADRQPVSGFSYSNAHYVILGAIIEKQTKLPLASALKSLVFEPAGLASARLIRTSADDPDALGYSENLEGALGSPQLDRRLTRELATAGDAAGGIAINAPDLAQWAADYFSGRFVKGVTFEAPSGGMAFGLAGDRISVGPGVYEVTYSDRVLRLHGGDGLGVSALAVYEPAKDRSVAILINDEKARSLGFGEPGFLDAFAMELLGE
jgi:D-alanyl-D-alanine carboxypeptidase